MRIPFSQMTGQTNQGNDLLPFLGAPTHLYNWLCPSVGRSVGRLVGRLVGHARVENLEKKQKSLEMIQKYARMT